MSQAGNIREQFSKFMDNITALGSKTKKKMATRMASISWAVEPRRRRAKPAKRMNLRIIAAACGAEWTVDRVME